MTRLAIPAVIALAALGSSCLAPAEASAFCRCPGGYFLSPLPIGPRPLAPGPAMVPPGPQASFAAIRHFRQTRPAAPGPHAIRDSRQMSRGPGLFAEVTAAVACGGLCATPGPDGMPARQGSGGVAGGAGGSGRTNSAAISGPGSGVSKTNGLAVTEGGSGAPVFGGKWAGIGAGRDAEDTAFRAIALGLSDDGAWIVRTAPTLATAGTGALRACNEQFGRCTLSDAQVAPTAFGCLVVIQSDDASRVFAASGDSFDAARATAAAQIADAGLRGQIVFTGCNS